MYISQQKNRFYSLCFFLTIGYALLTSCSTTVSSFKRPAEWAQPQQGAKIDNFYKVDSVLFRSGQPDKKQLMWLEAQGFKTIINLRISDKDEELSKGSSLRIIHLPLTASELTYNDLVSVLRVVNDAEKPVLIHCFHGSDRTGAVVAAYRINNCGWSREDAIKEFEAEEFGYHKFWFPKIPDLLRSIDVEQMKKEVGGRK